MSKESHAHKPDAAHQAETHRHDDDVIVVPKGSSRARFLMTAILALLVLTTFTVSGEVVDVLTGRNSGKNAYMRWKRPDGKVEEVKASDFMIRKQEISKVETILSGGRNSRERDDARIARQMIVDELAQEAGIEVTDAELADLIRQAFGSKEIYARMLQSYRTTAKEFEATWRSLLRVNRYEQLLSQAAAVPDPADVVQRWKASHKEYSLDTIELATDRFAEEAKSACPAGEELKAWFEALPEGEKLTFRTPLEAKTSAEFAWFSFDPQTKLERILERFPRPADEKPEEVAKNWYAANKDLLFKKPNLPAGKTPSDEDYVPFEEAKDRAQAQGLAFQSMTDWVRGMQARVEGGEMINLGPEASGMSLAYRREVTPHSRGGWKAAGMAFSGQAPLAALFAPTSEPGKLLPDVLIDANGLFVGRLLEKQDSRLPAFEEFQDKVREAWILRKQGELAQAKLESLRAKLPTEPDPKDPAGAIPVEPDAAKFQAAAAELGLEAKTQDWFDPAAPQKGITDPLLLFERQAARTMGEVVGTVSKPSLSADKTKAWLARLVGSRDPDQARMTPQDYSFARRFAEFDGRNKFLESTFGSDEYLKQRYGLELEAWRREESEKNPPQN